MLCSLIQVLVSILCRGADSTETEEAEDAPAAAKKAVWRVELQRPSRWNPPATHHRNQSHWWDDEQSLRSQQPAVLIIIAVKWPAKQPRSRFCLLFYQKCTTQTYFYDLMIKELLRVKGLNHRLTTLTTSLWGNSTVQVRMSCSYLYDITQYKFWFVFLFVPQLDSEASMMGCSQGRLMQSTPALPPIASRLTVVAWERTLCLTMKSW